MTDEVTRHYETLLAANYSWMSGADLAEKIAEQRDLLAKLIDGSPVQAGMAADLGAGPGYQAFALADLGFAPVLALDTSAILLAELEGARNGRNVTAIQADICDVAKFVKPGAARIVACMGDTLPHLPSPESVKRLFAEVFTTLPAGGLFILTFRDLSREVTGLDRFISIRNDAQRIMTCFLEFEAETVTVHDLIHSRGEAGWTLAKSSYRKLRLSPDHVVRWLSDAGFEIARNETAGRLQAIVGRRP